MKHRFSFLLIATIGLLPATDAAAQNVVKYAGRALVKRVPLTRAEKALLPSPAGLVTHEINYNIGNTGKADLLPVLSGGQGQIVTAGASQQVFVPAPLLDYTPYLHQLSPNVSLRKADFPALWQRNENMIRRSLEHSLWLLSSVQRQDAAFYSSLRSDVLDGTLPYHKYLPADGVDYIFVGEVHHNPLIQEELIRLLQVLKNRYPTRNVYLATEYAWDAQRRSSLEEEIPLAIARDKKELRTLLGNDYVNLFFLHKAIENGIPVVGLEPRFAMANEVIKHTGVDDPARLQMYIRRLSVSEIGIQMRNKRWAKHIAQIRAQDPNALVVVHGGGHHISLHNLFSVPNMLRGKKFTMMLIDWRGKEITAPLLSKLDDQNFLAEQFAKAKEGKYLIYFKRPNASVGRTPGQLQLFKHAFGADMFIFVDDLSPMIIP